MQKIPHLLLLIWLVMIGIIIFAAFVCIDRGLLQAMIAQDKSNISIVLITMYALGLGHSLRASMHLSQQLKHSAKLDETLAKSQVQRIHHHGNRLTLEDNQGLPDCVITRYVLELTAVSSLDKHLKVVPKDHTNLLDVQFNSFQSQSEFGWFLIDIMLKIGFLGTLIGFILMLGSISHQNELNPGMMQQVIQQMSIGMSTALYTTLASIVGAVLLAIPYYLFDRALQELIEHTVRLTEVKILPRLHLIQGKAISWPYATADNPDTARHSIL